MLLLLFAPASVRGKKGDPAHRPSEVIIKFKEKASRRDRDLIVDDLGGTRLRKFPRIGAELHRITNRSVEEAIAIYAHNPLVEYIEPNYIVHALETPNDPRFGDLWGLLNVGQTGGRPGADIHATQAWDVFTGSSQVLIGVIDTGVDYTHPDLQANIFVNPGEVPGNGIDDDGNGFIDDVRGWDFVNGDNDPFDDFGHGTHVAGTIGAVGNNGVGVVGVNWNVRILPLKFLDSGGFGSTADAISAVEYATMMGVRLTSNSWGGGGFSQGLSDAIADAGNAGILFVAAAGNNGSDNDAFPTYPASYDLDNIIAVAATDHNDQLAGFSNFGANTVDLAAPGVNILSTVPGNSYASFSGTSMATPHVSGVLGLVFGRFPNIGAAQAKDRILNFVDRLPNLEGIVRTGGRLNSFLPLADPDSIPPGAITDLGATAANATWVDLAWTATGDDGAVGKASRYEVRYSTAPFDDAHFADATLAHGAPDPQVVGSPEHMRVSNLAFSTGYYFAVKAFDEFGNQGPISNLASRTTLGPPDITVAPLSVGADLFTGNTATRTITIGNTGIGELRFELQVADQGPVGAAVAPPHRAGSVAPDPGPPSLVPYAQGRQPERARTPDGRPRVAASGTARSSLAGAGSKLLLLTSGAPVDEIQYFLSSVPGVDSVGVFDGTFAVPTLNQLLDFDAVLVIVNQRMGDPEGAGDVLADYADAGGGVVLTLASFISGWAVQGRLLTGGYMPFQLGSGPIGSSTLGTFDASHPIMQGVTTASGDLLGAVALAPGAQDVARWVNGQPFVATQGDNVAAVNIFLADGGFWHGDIPLLLYNAAQFTSGAVRFLSFDPVSGVVPAGSSVDVAIRLDATGLNGGDYVGHIAVHSDDPDTAPVVTANLHVTGAPDIGLATTHLDFGNVFTGSTLGKDLRVANEGTDLLHVTSIGVDSPRFTVNASSFTLAPGERRDVRVTFAPTAPVPETGTLTIQSDDPDESVVTVALQGTGLIPPDIVIDWNPTCADLLTNETETRTLTLRNTGGSDLQYAISVVGHPTSALAKLGHDPRGARAAKSPASAAGRSRIEFAGDPPRFAVATMNVSAGKAPQRQPESRTFGSGTQRILVYADDVFQAPGQQDVDLALQRLGVPYTAYYFNPAGFAAALTQGDWDLVIVDHNAFYEIGNHWNDLENYVVGGGKLLVSTFDIDGSDSAPTNLWNRLGLTPGADLQVPPPVRWWDPSHRLFVSPESVPEFTQMDPFYSDSGDKVDPIAPARGVAGFVVPPAPREAGIVVSARYNAIVNSFLVVQNHSDRDADGMPDAVELLENEIDYLLKAASWVQVSAYSGVVPAGGSVDLTVTYDAAGLFGGDYSADILVDTNDPDEAESVLLACMHVTGVPDISVQGEEQRLESVATYSTSGASTHHTLMVTEPPAGGGELELFADGDYGDFFEKAVATAEGVSLGQVGATGSDCSQAHGTFPIAAATLASLVADGVVHVDVDNTPDVDVFCALNQHHIVLRYHMAADQVDFGGLFVGLCRTRTLTVTNDGTDVLNVTAVQVDNPVFTAGVSSFTLAPRESRDLEVTFCPPTPTPESGTLVIRSNDTDEGTIQISLQGQGLIPPEIAVDWDSTRADLLTNTTTSRPLTVHNNGGSDLQFTVVTETGTFTPTVLAASPVFGAAAGQAPARSPAALKAVATTPPPEPASVHVLASPRMPPDPRQAASVRSGFGMRAAAAVAASPAPRVEAATLEHLLENLNQNFGAVTAAIPNRFDFSEGVAGSSISDGGNDMYDGGNFLSTDLAPTIQYSDNAIVNSPAFGAGGRYFTRKYPGLFVLVAEMSGVSDFVISGNLGADGGGNVDGVTLGVSAGGRHFLGFVKRVYNAGDPSVNHLVIVEEGPEPVTHEFATDTNDDFHRVRNLTGVTRIYYALYAGANGSHIDDAATTTILERFLDALDLTPEWLRVAPETGTVPPHASQQLTVTFDATGAFGGIYSGALRVLSNDPRTPEGRFPASLHVTGVPDIEVLGAQITLESSQDFQGPSAVTHHTLELTVPPEGPGKLELIAQGDFGDFDETATAIAEGRVIGAVGSTGIDCSPAQGTFDIAAADLAAVAADGVVHVDVQNSPAVDLFCFPDRHQIRLRYFGPSQQLDFRQVFIGQSAGIDVQVVNAGTQSLTVGAAANHAAFDASPSHFTVAPEGKQLVHVTFHPSSAGVAQGVLTFASNDPDEPEVTMGLRGEGLVPPVIVADPTALSVQLDTGETETRPITLSNHGGSDLNWNAATQLHSSFVTVHPYLERKKNEPDPRTGAPVVQGRGGPDRFGYEWMDSDEPGGPVFSWEDIRSTGTPVFPFSVDDANFGPFPIGFTFPYYGNSFTSFRVCSNGFISFTSESATFGNQPLPNFGAPENLLAAFWSDLWVDLGAGNVYYRSDGNRLIVQFNVRHLSGGGPYAFQILLFPSGEIRYQYLTMAPPLTVATIGMQNGQRDDGLMMVFNNAYVHDNLAIRLSAAPAWLHVSPESGTVPAGGSAVVTAEFDARALPPGPYDAGIQITSNDPVHPRIDVAVHLGVRGAPNIGVDPLALDFGNAFIGFPRSLSVHVTNTGTDVLSVSGITSGSPAFGADPTTFDLAPAGSRVVNVAFTPAATGAVISALHIHSNDPNQPDVEVSLAGTGLVPPEIHASPTSLAAAVLPGGQTTKVLHVCNQGGSPLTFSASASAGAASVPVYPPLEVGRSQVDPRPGILGTGGPDRFGYRWTDSGEPDGPQFAWVDIRSTGTPVFNSSGYPSAGPFPIGFPFHFYGNTFSQFYVSYLGMLSFTSLNAFFVNQPLPSAGAPENLLAVFWDDLILDTALGGQVYYRNDGSKLIVQYENLYRFDAFGPPFFSFEILLYPSGEIVYQYRTLGAVTNSATIGTQNDMQNDGLLIAFNHAYVHENLAVRVSRIPQWLAVSPTSGVVQAGGCADLQLTMDATELVDSDHTASLNLSSNDPRTPVVTVPVTLHVGSITPAVTDVEPNTLNLDNNGKWVTAYVELPSGYDPARVLIESVILNGGVPADVHAYSGPGDFNHNGIPDLTLKFDRSLIERILPERESVPISIIGEIEDTTFFTGQDVIRVIRPKMVSPNGGEGILAGSSYTVRWTNPNGWNIDHADLFYTVDAGRNWLELRRGIQGTSCVWTVPPAPCDSAEVRVFVYSPQELLGFDTTDMPFRILGSPTEVVEQDLPRTYALHPNVPNPFNPSTQIGFDLPEEARVRLRIYDARGRLVRQLLDARLPAGRHDAHWSGEDDSGAHLSSGVYFCEIVAGPFSATRRLILAK